MEIAFNVVLTIVGLAMLCFGGNWLVTGGVIISKKLGISQMLIGMTVVAYGTSTPELAASIAAVGQHTQLILGNIVGSNIANIGMVIGISAILVPLVVQKSSVRKEIPIMIGVSLLLIALSVDNVITQLEGVLLLGGLVVFTVFLYQSAKKQRSTLEKPKEKSPEKKYLIRALGLVGIGVSLLWIGAWLTVDNAVIIAQSIGISERIIGLTVIAIGTSLPELITSIIAIKKGHHDIGIGNIIGSNIYNVLMIIGVAGAIGGIVVVPDVFIDYGVMIAFSLVLLIVLKLGVLPRPLGVGLLVGYVGYLGWLLFLS